MAASLYPTFEKVNDHLDAALNGPSKDRADEMLMALRLVIEHVYDNPLETLDHNLLATKVVLTIGRLPSNL